MRTKKLDLCGRCAAIFGETYKVERVSGGADCKVTCENCKKRRYGGTYTITNTKNKNSQ